MVVSILTLDRFWHQHSRVSELDPIAPSGISSGWEEGTGGGRSVSSVVCCEGCKSVGTWGALLVSCLRGESVTSLLHSAGECIRSLDAGCAAPLSSMAEGRELLLLDSSIDCKLVEASA